MDFSVTWLNSLQNDEHFVEAAILPRDFHNPRGSVGISLRKRERERERYLYVYVYIKEKNEEVNSVHALKPISTYLHQVFCHHLLDSIS